MPAARATGTTRPRWLLPAVVGGIGVAVLVAYGVLSPSAVLYGGLFGGMLLMHVGGHGGHGGHGTLTGTEDLRRPSVGSEPDRTGSAAQPDRTGSGAQPDHASSNEPNGNETHDHDQRGSHGCH